MYRRSHGSLRGVRRDPPTPANCDFTGATRSRGAYVALMSTALIAQPPDAAISDAVTGGPNALGETTVLLDLDGQLARGRASRQTSSRRRAARTYARCRTPSRHGRGRLGPNSRS